MKECTRCRLAKPVSQFSPDRRRRSGLQSHCRECKRPYGAAYRAANREKALAYAREYYAANRERFAEYQANYRANLTAEQIEVKREYTRAWRQAHPEWVKALNYASNKVRWILSITLANVSPPPMAKA